MKVKKNADERISGGESGFQARKKGLSSPARGTEPRPFSQSLEDAETMELIEKLELLGRKMTQFPAESTLQQYRNLVKELLRRAIGGLRIRRDMKWRRNDRNLYVTVEKVESILGELEVVFRREGERTRMLQLMEEVKGCLISLLL
ncbi:hypothetical protein C8D99_10415 [Aminivibrio pyruvatiphilus]|uniref:DUF327 family protein n=1 Tax=Aminivibrio pyruvatiphilus TaxID=1005740 RepID=A0A4R8MC54_9BACT|nr:DUF327 family protein [Aminivibrio pyruvatiphilus]TDY61777.1 hypothetical protein C8D99_10415 [Aminivibrio pyruvatiphilus]